VFHVTSAGSPQTFTAGAGAPLTGAWPLPAGQDVRVHGPNGFYRQFTGPGPDITAAPPGPDLRLKIASTSPAVVKLTVSDAYSGRSFPVIIPPRATVPVLVPSDHGTGWYDIAVTSSAGPSYLRRLAGHVETGLPSISDPARGKP
jgi:phospholipase C